MGLMRVHYLLHTILHFIHLSALFINMFHLMECPLFLEEFTPLPDQQWNGRGHSFTIFPQHMTYHTYKQTLQGKYPLAKVIKEVFSVINLEKIFKKTFVTTSVYGYGSFGRAFNRNSTQLKKMGGRRLLRMFFHRYSTLPLTHRCVHADSATGLCQSNALGCLGVKPHQAQCWSYWAILIGLGICAVPIGRINTLVHRITERHRDL